MAKITKPTLYKILGATGLVSIPVATTLGVVIGTKEEKTNMGKTEAVSFGDKFFDQQMSEGTSSFAQRQLLTPYRPLTGGGNLSELVRLDFDFDSTGAHNMLAVDSDNKEKPALGMVKIQVKDILNQDQLSAAFLKANVELKKVADANSGKPLGIYIGKDLRTREVTASVYEVKGVNATEKKVLDDLLDDMKISSTINTAGLSSTKFIQLFGSQNTLRPDQTDYFNVDYKGQTETAFESALDTKYKRAAINGQTLPSESGYNSSWHKWQIDNGLKPDQHFKIAGTRKNAGHTLLLELAKQNLITTFETVIDWKNNEAKIIYRLWKMDGTSSVSFDLGDRIRNSIGQYTRTVRIPFSSVVSHISTINTTQRADARTTIKKFLSKDMPRYAKNAIVKNGLPIMGNIIPSLSDALAKVIEVGELLAYDIATPADYASATGIDNPNLPTYVFNPHRPEQNWHKFVLQEEVIKDEFLDKIIDRLLSDTSIDFDGVIDLMKTFENDAFNGTDPYWTSINKLQKMYVTPEGGQTKSGQYTLYQITSFFNSTFKMIEDKMKENPAYAAVKADRIDSSLIEKLLNYLKHNGVVSKEFTLGDLMGNPIEEVYKILSSIAKKQIQLPEDIIRGALPLVPVSLVSDHLDGIVKAITYVTSGGNLESVLKLLGNNDAERLKTVKDLITPVSSDDRWAAVGRITQNTHASLESIQTLFMTIKLTGILPESLNFLLGDTHDSAETYSKLFANKGTHDIFALVKQIFDKGLFNMIGDTWVEGVDADPTHTLTTADIAKITTWFKNNKADALAPIAAFKTSKDLKDFLSASPTVNDFTSKAQTIVEKLVSVLKVKGISLSTFRQLIETYLPSLLSTINTLLSKPIISKDEKFGLYNQIVNDGETAKLYGIIQTLIATAMPSIKLPSIEQIKMFVNLVAGAGNEGLTPFLDTKATQDGSSRTEATKQVIETILTTLFPSGFAKGNADWPAGESWTNEHLGELINGLLNGFSDKTKMWNAMSLFVPATYEVKDTPIGSIELDIKKILGDIFTTGTFSKSILIVTAHPDQNLGKALQKILKTGLLSLAKDDFKNLLESLKRPIKASGFLSGTVEDAANDAITKLGPVAGILGLINREGSDNIAQTLFDILHKPLKDVQEASIDDVIKLINSLGLLKTPLPMIGTTVHIVLNDGIGSILPLDIQSIAHLVGLSDSITEIITKALFGMNYKQHTIDNINDYINALTKPKPSDVALTPGATLPAGTESYASLSAIYDAKLAPAKNFDLPLGEIISNYRALVKAKGDIDAYVAKVKHANKELNDARLDLKSKITAIPTKKLLTDTTMTLPTIDFDATLAKVSALTNNIIDGMDIAHLKEAEGWFRDLDSYNTQVAKMNHDFVTLGANVETLIAQITSITDIPLTPGATVPAQTFATLKAKLVAFGTTSVGKTMAELTEFRKDYNNLQTYLDTVRANNAELIQLRTRTQELMNTIPAKVNLEVGANAIRGKDYDALKAELDAITTDATTVTTAKAKSYKAKYDEIVRYIENVNTNNKELHDARLELKTKLKNISPDIAIISGADISTLRGETYASLTGALPTVADVDTKSVVEIRQINVKYGKIATYLARVTALNKEYTDLKAEVTAIAATTLPAEVTVLPSVTDITGLKGVTYTSLKGEWDALVALNVTGITKAGLTTLKTNLNNKLKQINKYNENVGKLNSGGKIGISDVASLKDWLIANAESTSVEKASTSTYSGKVPHSAGIKYKIDSSKYNDLIAEGASIFSQFPTTSWKFFTAAKFEFDNPTAPYQKMSLAQLLPNLPTWGPDTGKMYISIYDDGQYWIDKR